MKIIDNEDGTFTLIPDPLETKLSILETDNLTTLEAIAEVYELVLGGI